MSTISRSLATYQATRALLDAGFSVMQVGRAMLALETPDDQLPGEDAPLDEPADEHPPYEPSEEDRADHARWADRLEEHLTWLRHLEELPATYPDDRDIMAAGLAVG